jgi:hypothetical protein
MLKRGQFYFIAALVIIMIFAGLRFIYISADTSFDSSFINDLGREIHYEGNQLIINRVLDDVDEDEIVLDLGELREYYIHRHNNIEIILFFDDGDDTWVIGEVGESIGEADSECELGTNKVFCVVVESQKDGEEIKIVF